MDDRLIYDHAFRMMEALLKSGSYNEYTDLPHMAHVVAKTTVTLCEELHSEFERYHKRQNLNRTVRSSGQTAPPPYYGHSAAVPMPSTAANNQRLEAQKAVEEMLKYERSKK